MDAAHRASLPHSRSPHNFAVRCVPHRLRSKLSGHSRGGRSLRALLRDRRGRGRVDGRQVEMLARLPLELLVRAGARPPHVRGAARAAPCALAGGTHGRGDDGGRARSGRRGSQRASPNERIRPASAATPAAGATTRHDEHADHRGDRPIPGCWLAADLQRDHGKPSARGAGCLLRKPLHRRLASLREDVREREGRAVVVGHRREGRVRSLRQDSQNLHGCLFQVAGPNNR